MALSLIADKSSKLAQLLDLAHTEGIKEQTKAQHEDFQVNQITFVGGGHPPCEFQVGLTPATRTECYMT